MYLKIFLRHIISVYIVKNKCLPFVNEMNLLGIFQVN